MESRAPYLLVNTKGLNTAKKKFFTSDNLKAIDKLLVDIEDLLKLPLNKKHIDALLSNFNKADSIVKTLKIFILILKQNGVNVEEKIESALISLEPRVASLCKKFEDIENVIKRISDANTTFANKSSTDLQISHAKLDIDEIKKSEYVYLLSEQPILETTIKKIEGIHKIAKGLTKEFRKFVFSVLQPLLDCLHQIIPIRELKDKRIPRSVEWIPTLKDLISVRNKFEDWKQKHIAFFNYAKLISSFYETINNWLLNFGLDGGLPKDKQFVKESEELKTFDSGLQETYNVLAVPFLRVISTDEEFVRQAKLIIGQHETVIKKAESFLVGLGTLKTLKTEIDTFLEKIQTFSAGKEMAKQHYREASRLQKQRMDPYSEKETNKHKYSLAVVKSDSKYVSEAAALFEIKDIEGVEKVETLWEAFKTLKSIDQDPELVKAKEKFIIERDNFGAQFPEAVRREKYRFFDTKSTSALKTMKDTIQSRHTKDDSVVSIKSDPTFIPSSKLQLKNSGLFHTRDDSVISAKSDSAVTVKKPF